jgi:hypothetical protein
VKNLPYPGRYAAARQWGLWRRWKRGLGRPWRIDSARLYWLLRQVRAEMED